MKTLSYRWFKKATDEELEEEREKIRTMKTETISDAQAQYITLRKIDDEMTGRLNRKYKTDNPDAKQRYREHGWYLPNDE